MLFKVTTTPVDASEPDGEYLARANLPEQFVESVKMLKNEDKKLLTAASLAVAAFGAILPTTLIVLDNITSGRAGRRVALPKLEKMMLDDLPEGHSVDWGREGIK